MTPKEAEHFLIDNGWEYTRGNPPLFFPYWSYRGREYPSVTDELVQESPEKAVSFVKDVIGIIYGHFSD